MQDDLLPVGQLAHCPLDWKIHVFLILHQVISGCSHAGCAESHEVKGPRFVTEPCHFPHILLDKSNQKASPESRGGGGTKSHYKGFGNKEL